MSGMNSWTEEDIRRIAGEVFTEKYQQTIRNWWADIFAPDGEKWKTKWAMKVAATLPDADADQPESQATQGAEDETEGKE